MNRGTKLVTGTPQKCTHTWDIKEDADKVTDNNQDEHRNKDDDKDDKGSVLCNEGALDDGDGDGDCDDDDDGDDDGDDLCKVGV